MLKFIPAVIFCSVICFGVSAAGPLPVYKDKNAPVHERVADLLSRMTLREKVLQLQNRSAGNSGEIAQRFNGEGIGTIHDMDHNVADCRTVIADIQNYMINDTRLGIPALPCVEGIEGVLQNGATIFPHALAQGSTFNPQLIERMTEACGEEAMAMGLHQILSPVLDIARELRWGRIEETFGEDPYLISEIATGFINGYQKHPISCMPKHFVAHGSPTGGLNCAQVSGGQRELHNLYLYPFAKVIAATRPQAVMSCYSAYDGVPVSGSRYYMTDVLRGQLGFDGYVYSDWGSVERLKTFHHSVATIEDAARQSLIAGIDIDIDDAYRTLEQQVESGLIPVEYVDTAVSRVLRAKFALGLFDNPPADGSRLDSVHSPGHVAIAKEVADESAILLENNGILPLDLSRISSIAVVGPNAAHAVLGDYSWVRPDENYGVSLLDGLRDRLGDNVTVNYAQGCDWWSQDDSGIQEAVEAAEKSDVAVVAIGTRSTYLARSPRQSTAGEGFDMSSLDLPGRQLDLLKAVKATGKPMVVVFISGKPLAMPWVKENVDALLVQWYGGEQQGNTAADILLGNVNPSGRLNVSFPRSTGNTPCYYNYYATDKEYGSDHGGTYDEPATRYVFESPYALWPFGSGRSYTDFSYGNFKVSVGSDTIYARVDVSNTGTRPGKEVVQLYVTDVVSSALTPVRQLKGFEKVSLAPGETVTVNMAVPFSELMFVDESLRRVLEPGEFQFHVGKSSDDILFTESVVL